MSAAVALFAFTMKFECFVETCAPPMVKPFRPLASIRRAAWSSGGLRKTLPAFGSFSGCDATRCMRSSFTRAIAARSSPRSKEKVPETNHSSRFSWASTWR